MSLLRLALAMCTTAVLLMGSAAQSETRLIQNNDPTLLLTSGIEDVLSRDHKAMKQSGGGLLRRLLTRPEGEQPTLVRDAAWLAGLPEATGDAEWQCLTKALYFEARGESVTGQFAVAEVILNRRDSGRFPSTVCGVVSQGGTKRAQCQFSFMCDGREEQISEHAAWVQVGKIARLMLDGAPRDLTQGATYYHNSGVRPAWARRFERTTHVGPHFFYRTVG